MFELVYYNIREARWVTHKFYTESGAVLAAEHHSGRYGVGAVEVWGPGSDFPLFTF